MRFQFGILGIRPSFIDDFTDKSIVGRRLNPEARTMANAFEESKKTKEKAQRLASYQLLRQTEPLILERQGTKDMDAVLLDNEQREAEIVTADGIRLTVKHSYSLGWEPGAKGAEWPETACIILRLGKEDYLVIGSGVVVTFQQRIGLAKCEEVEIVDGKQRIIRHLNGDQTHQGRHVRIPVGAFQIQHFKLYRY